jgi:uncharacterized protein YbbC (DUF1343 family)
MQNLNYFVFTICLLTNLSCNEFKKEQKVLTGLDRISEHEQLFKGKKIGIITNHSAYNSNDIHIIDVFQKKQNVEVVALFGPEHGIKGKEDAGAKILNEMSEELKVQIYSLYGKTLKPTPQMLQDCDMLVFDIQDIGTRYYTYISTMALCMEASAENNKQFVVLDRPNPLNGNEIEGNLLEKDFATFVGMFPVPVRHGLTIGEYAQMINGEKWLNEGIQANLSVIKMNGWKRDMWYDETGLKWRSPSPNIPDLQVATIYPGTCLFEGTNISEGRGTYQPFLKIGAPWFNENNLLLINKLMDIPGAQFVPISFTPKSISGMSTNPKYVNQTVQGLKITINNRNTFKPYITGIELVKNFFEHKKEKFKWRKKHFDRLCGTNKIRKFIIAGKPISEIKEWCKKDIESFLGQRAKYLLY